MWIFGLSRKKENANRRYEKLFADTKRLGTEKILYLVEDAKEATKTRYHTLNTAIKTNWHGFLSYVPFTSFFKMRCACASALEEYQDGLKGLEVYLKQVRNDNKHLLPPELKKVESGKAEIASQAPNVKPENKPKLVKKTVKSFFFRTHASQPHATVSEEVYVPEEPMSQEYKNK